MGDSFDHPGSRKGSEVANIINNKNTSKRCFIASSPKSGLQSPTRNTVPFSHIRMGGTAGDAALFLLKVAALETLRRFSKARCPVVWCGIQALQALCYPPLKWIQRWGSFRGLISSMQALSRPLLVLSIATAFSDQPGGCNVTSAVEDSQGANDSQASSVSNLELPLVQSTLDASVLDEAPQSHQSSTNWLFQLYEELKKHGINLPERINEDELQKFYIAANRDLPCLLSSVKKTILWRKTFYILSEQELEMWSNMVFWHGVDVNCRHCLIVRLGLAFGSLSPRERPRFLQAVVSQVEHGILHLVDPGNPRITVLVDCQGLSPLRFPMQMMRSCFSIFQEHYPGRLGFVFVIRVPPLVRVIAHTVTKVLKPGTRAKLKIVGEMYQKILEENFETLPLYLGGTCTCVRCSTCRIRNMGLVQINDTTETERKTDVNGCEDMPSPRQSNLTDMHMNGNCDQALGASVIAVLIFWVLIAFLARVYDPESSPALPL